MKGTYILLVLALIGAMNSRSQSMVEVWKDFPEAIMPTIDINARLDMIDLYQAGMYATAPTLLNDTARLITVGDTYLEARTSKLSTIQIKRLGRERKPLYAVVFTVETPTPHSHVELYNHKWEHISIGKRLPKITEDNFICKDVVGIERENLLAQVQVCTIQYKMSEEDGTLTLYPSFLDALDARTRKEIEQYFIEKLQLKWNGKKWTIKK